MLIALQRILRWFEASPTRTRKSRTTASERAFGVPATSAKFDPTSTSIDWRSSVMLQA
jgi:hypothetical protein